MKRMVLPMVLVGCVIGNLPHAQADTRTATEALSVKIAEVARLTKSSAEQTKRTHNEELNKLFVAYVEMSGGVVEAATVRHFNALVKQYGMTNFDDFLAAMTAPLRYVHDPASGDRVPMFGALGSDSINPWLVAVGVVEGKPLEDQPMYRLASHALSEHVDFALIGIKDPTLSLELLPAELQANAALAYRRLNPQNKFAGGFDQPLFYATVREAARKLFREDYPRAKIDMAEVVKPEHGGGLGIRSCLLCHDDCTAVYARVLGQALFLEAKAEDRRRAPKLHQEPSDSRAQEDADQIEAQAAVMRRAAQRMLDAYGEDIDQRAALDSLGTLSPQNQARLMPGFEDFFATLKQVGCLKCHSTEGSPPAERNPSDYDVFVLTPNDYFKSKNVRALAELVKMDDVSKSKLLLKAEGTAIHHEGKEELRLTKAQLDELRAALARWTAPYTAAEEAAR
ncbi:MAG: hypothetical protein HY000_02190 [Planctomycetes bacterium]|nr:hypothetical protein [Planctomycetota bacterium]